MFRIYDQPAKPLQTCGARAQHSSRSNIKTHQPSGRVVNIHQKEPDEQQIFSDLIALADLYKSHKVNKQTIKSILRSFPDQPNYLSQEQLQSFKRFCFHGRPNPSNLTLLLLSRINKAALNLDKLKHKHSSGSLDTLGVIFHTLEDQVRTKKFMNAVEAAMNQLSQLRNGSISVVDAGCGPIPILGIYAALCAPERAKVTCIESNPCSAQIAKEVVKSIGLADRITVVEGDATKYQVNEPIDLLVSETINNGLQGEALVDIMNNLHHHLAADGIVLPKAVKVTCGLVSEDLQLVRKDGKHLVIYDKDFGPIPDSFAMGLGLENSQTVTYKPGDDLNKINFNLSLDLADGNYCPVVSTTLDLGSDRVNVAQSFVTMPTELSMPINQEVRVTPSIAIGDEDHGSGEFCQISYAPSLGFERSGGIIDISIN